MDGKIPEGNWTEEGVKVIKSIRDKVREYVNGFDQGCSDNDWQVLVEIGLLIDMKVLEGYLPREASHENR